MDKVSERIGNLLSDFSNNELFLILKNNINIFFFYYSAMLSDVPHDSETEFGADPYEIEDDLEEEPDFVPIDMSAKGGNLF